MAKARGAFSFEADRHRKCLAAVGSCTSFTESFNALMKAIFEPLGISEHKWGAAVIEKACISGKVYRNMRNGVKLPSHRTVAALCGGFDLDISIAEKLLDLCGKAFSNSDEHIAFRYVLTAGRGWSITKRSDWLEAMGFGRLSDDGK